MLLVYVKERLHRHVSDVEVDQVPTGMHGIMVRRAWSASHHGEMECSLHPAGEQRWCWVAFQPLPLLTLLCEHASVSSYG